MSFCCMWTWRSQLLPDLIPCLKIFLRIIELFKHQAPQMKFPIFLQFYVDKQNHWTFSLHCVSQRLHFILMNRALCGTFYKTFFWNNKNELWLSFMLPNWFFVSLSKLKPSNISCVFSCAESHRWRMRSFYLHTQCQTVLSQEPHLGRFDTLSWCPGKHKTQSE